MQYMLLIYTDPTVEPPQGWDQLNKEYFAYTEELVAAGKLRGGAPLEGPEAATILSVRDGKRTTTDGPFAETKEVLGGYYEIEAADLDEALDWAAKIPGAAYGSIEVRPVVELPGM